MEIGPKTQKVIGITAIAVMAPILVPAIMILAGPLWLTLKLEPLFAMSKEWHPWFAWRPVRIEDRDGWSGHGPMVWFERLERRNQSSFGDPWPVYRRAFQQPPSPQGGNADQREPTDEA